MRKKMLWKMISLALAASLLWGCGRSGGEALETPSRTERGQEEAKEPSADRAMGRYVENQVEFPPLGPGEAILDIVQNPEGNLELFMKDEGGAVRRYALRGEEWEEEEESILKKAPGVHVQWMTYGPDGALYLLYKGEGYEDHIGRVAENGELEDILTEQTKELRYGLNLYVAEDGLALVSQMDNVMMYRPGARDGGVQTVQMAQSAYFSDGKSSNLLSGDTYIATGERGFVRYSLEDGGILEEIPFQSGEGDADGSLAPGEGRNFYLCNSQGIHHITENGRLWETVVDGSLNSLGMPSVSPKKMFTGGEKDFFVWYIDNGKFKMAHYTYDPQMPSVPSQVLTVYGLDLSENQTLRQAASLFQMENPDVKVEVIDGKNEAGGATVSDIIRTLNTELLGGKGADVLVLDGLPADSYIEKGVLEDLRDVVNPMVEEGELYGSLVSSLTREDGGIYQAPTRIRFPIAYGEEAAVDSFSDLKSLNAYQSGHESQALIGRTNYENVLRMLVYLYYDSLWNPETGEPDGESLELLLDTAKKVGDGCGAEAEFVEEDLKNYNRTVKNGFFGYGYYDLNWGEAAMTVELPHGFQDMFLQFTVLKNHSYPLRQPNGVYFPSGCLGVNKAGAQKETAKEFVRFALSEKVQGNDLSDGFPVSRKGAEVWQKDESRSQHSASVGWGDGRHLSGSYPNPEERKELLALIEQLRIPSSPDEVVLEMVVKESKEFFEGRITARDAAAAIVNRVGLYRAE